MRKTATYPAKVKALVDEAGVPTGEFEIIASVMGTVDLQGDRVMKGAFEEDLPKSWPAGGHPFPIVFSHQWDNPDAYIGAADPKDVMELGADDPRVKEIAQDDPNVTGALYIKGTALDDPAAAKIHSLVAKGLIREASFSYDILPGGDRVADDGAHELTKLRLIEAGPTLMGAQPLARAGAKGLADQVAEIEKVLELEPTMTIAEARERLGLPALERRSEDDGSSDEGEKGMKRGARNAAADAKRIQGIHDFTAELGAACSKDSAGDEGKSGKADERESVKAEDRLHPSVALADIERRRLEAELAAVR